MSVSGVHAQPGGSVRVKASSRGLHLSPRSRWDFLDDDRVVGLSALWLLVVGLFGVAQLGSGSAPLGAVLLIAGIIGGIPALLQLVIEAVGYVVFLAVLPVVVIGFPLLFFRPVRRALGKLWGKPLKDRHLTPASAIAEVRVHPGPVVDVVRRDGGGVRLSANGRAGERLVAELAKLGPGVGRVA
ncbi:hypothetical protein [Phytomonospora endophytica]|uniref:Uncharacterized protein n=1 Tax=Phytomonospora endophytica TaxID=714109 RepID=A0A841FHM0_9ACTN|nr:hypothetical protein [Phytomonospora endophytica]MBB6034473.1 hypothetical protein [Phytomonospora endophytica]